MGKCARHGHRTNIGMTDRASPGANTLLAYFHYCNKAIYPFSAECKDQDLRTLAELDDKAISFVHFTRQLAAEYSESPLTRCLDHSLTKSSCREGMGGSVAPGSVRTRVLLREPAL